MQFPHIESFRGERWKQLSFPQNHCIHPEIEIYVSNYGRLVKHTGEDFLELKPYLLNGYPSIKVKTKNQNLPMGACIGVTVGF